MSLSLNHAELFKVGPITSRATLKLLPISRKKKKQKLVIGDDTGVVSSFQMKKGEPASVYKSVPHTNPITCITMGTSKGTEDKAYISSGQQVVGYSKKGKEFFKFPTNLSETINRVYAHDSKLWLSTDYIYNHFENGVDKDFSMSQDRINDLLLFSDPDSIDFRAILGCQDKYIRGNSVLTKKSTSGAITTLAKLGSQILYGTTTGTFGLVALTNSKLKTVWKTAAEKLAPSPITSMVAYDINKDDSVEIIVGREDGRVEVYSVDEVGTIVKEYEFVEKESIRSIQAGVLGTPGFDEIVLCTYSGRVMSLTSEPLDQPDADDSYGRSRGTVQRETRIVKLRKEIAALEEKVLKEKDRSTRKGDECLPVVEEIPVKCQYVLNPDNQTYDIAVELPVPIACVALHSSVPLDLLDTEKNQAILCRSPPDPANNTHVLATYRCQELTNRLEFRIRTLEGQFGDIELTVLAETVPKSAHCVKVGIKPLSLHHRVNIVDANEVDDEAMNSLHFTGAFSMVQVHEWISFCLPDVPVRMQDEECKMSMASTINFLTCLSLCRKGEARFHSSSVSTIAILKEVITKEATTRKITLNMTFDIKKESIGAVLRLLRPKLDEKQMLASQVKIIDGIKELQMHEADHSLWMSPEYQRILNDADRILRDFQASPRAMGYLIGVLTDLYVDLAKFRGVNPKPHLPRLFQLVEQYNFDALVDFFQRVH
ncbi:Bardet-Biedl syndrome 7 protein [Aphanomyces cochlioides]|nr:Bardet-Biedl syndrome 7 protein [Aphanomyces cochlioides]